jgi:methionine synthase II (cobalamin-independent)
MQYNTDRILTTHVGSLPRPDRLLETMAAMQQYDSPKPANYQEQCAEAVNDIVRKQVESGIDVISDGEMSKVSYIGYVSDRLRGISVQPTMRCGIRQARCCRPTLRFRTLLSIPITPNTEPSRRGSIPRGRFASDKWRMAMPPR